MQLAVCLLAVFAVVAYSGGLVVRVAARKASARLHSTGYTATWLVAPFVAASSVCSALVLPGVFFLDCHCVAHGLHHPHLCLHHPGYAAAVFLPAAVFAAVWACVALPRLALLIGGWWQTRAWVRHLANVPVQVLDGVRFCLIDAPGLGACTTGLLRPLVAVDRGLWRALDDEQRRAVLHHEEAHRRRLDPLSMFLLRACAAVSLFSNTAPPLRRWHARVEAECDRYAAEIVGSPESVASALLALECYHRAQPHSTMPVGIGAGGAALEVRVRALLDVDCAPPPSNLVSDAFAMTLVGVAVVLAVTLFGGDLVHHGAETVLGLFVSHP